VSLFDKTLTVTRPTTAYIPLAAGSWYEAQIYDFQPMLNPSDASQIRLYGSGMRLDGGVQTGAGEQSVGLLTASTADPHTWTNVGQVLTKGVTGEWDDHGVRMGSHFRDSDTGLFMLYYSGWSADGKEKIGVAYSFTGLPGSYIKHYANPILTPQGFGRNDGDFSSEPAVIKEDGLWTMIYGYRNGGTTLPGYRAAQSRDGFNWMKVGTGDVLTVSPLFGEFHHLVKFGENDYALIYEAGNYTTPYRIFVARATNVLGPYTNWAGNPLLPESGVNGRFDKLHTATPGFFSDLGTMMLFFCGASTYGPSDYPAHVYWENTWPGSIATINPPATIFDSAVFDDAIFDTGVSGGGGSNGGAGTPGGSDGEPSSRLRGYLGRR
jgi:hypothetical protein